MALSALPAGVIEPPVPPGTEGRTNRGLCEG
jgi:hypothetical protein